MTYLHSLGGSRNLTEKPKDIIQVGNTSHVTYPSSDRSDVSPVVCSMSVTSNMTYPMTVPSHVTPDKSRVTNDTVSAPVVKSSRDQQEVSNR